MKTSGFQGRRSRPTHLRAITLTEVMTALVILSVVVLGTAGFFAYAGGQIAIARSKRLAVEVASARLDELRACDYTEVDDRTELDVPFGLWTGDITTDVAEQIEGGARYKEVAVTINWHTPNYSPTRELDITMSSIVGKK